jgi:hypothetical protein
VVVTEKDAGKIRGLDSVPANCWYLEIDMAFVDEDVDARLEGLCKRHGIALP